MKSEKPSKVTLKKWHQDPKNWILGFLYYNKEDPRIFPPKRTSWTGWTVNFANPKSIGFLIGILLIVHFVLAYLK
ncbi:DUF5808 domain-containing protein [Flavobacterium crassostreae]|nr:DUF5808 domain-containing protein [Flavobacterium crassostreae]